MRTKRGFPGLAVATCLLLAAATASGDEAASRSGYSYIRMITGEATVATRWNGSVEARRNMPISVGDEISVSQGEGSRSVWPTATSFTLEEAATPLSTPLSDQQGEEDQFSAIRLSDGVRCWRRWARVKSRSPRIDTDDATVYLAAGARVRVNSDPRRGTVVIGRAGTAQVRTRTGTYTVKAGQFLIVRPEEEPEEGRGAYSRDRFDIWVADRLAAVEESRSASARYVSDQSAGDVAALDGYGDWDYDSSYGGEVWSPRVDTGWTPYSYGSWYYTPAGMTWWSNDPWGWYPFHYGNWFYASARNRWCWAPASVYSPAWVYWAYAPGYVGWCPTGNYSLYSPWSDGFYRQWGLAARMDLYFSMNGMFATRRVDFHGWNFTGGVLRRPARAHERGPGIANRGPPGQAGRHLVPPIVVNPREGGVREAIRTYVREAPRVIERAAGPDSERLAPVMARDRTLPADAVAALRERVVVTERGRLSGPTAADIAPRASASVVERSRLPSVSAGREPVAAERWRTSERGPVAGADQPLARTVPRSGADGPLARPRQLGLRRGPRELGPRERSVAPERQVEISRPDRGGDAAAGGSPRVLAIAPGPASRAPRDRRRRAGTAGAGEASGIAAARPRRASRTCLTRADRESSGLPASSGEGGAAPGLGASSRPTSIALPLRRLRPPRRPAPRFGTSRLRSAPRPLRKPRGDAPTDPAPNPRSPYSSFRRAHGRGLFLGLRESSWRRSGHRPASCVQEASTSGMFGCSGFGVRCAVPVEARVPSTENRSPNT